MSEEKVLTPEEKNEGIELIEKAIDILYGFGDEIAKDLKDGTMKLPEIIGLTDNIFAIAMFIPKFPQLKAQVLDVDSDEVQVLVQHVIDLGFLGDDAVIIISNIVAILEKGYAMYNENLTPIIDLIKAKRAANAV